MAAPPGWQWAPAAGAAVLVALGVRAAVSLHPHSGAGRPPMFGDLECQRHWMELAVALPVGDWYRNTSRNDLLYWGPDYPPLTLAAALGLGRAAQALAPGAVAWQASRGDESTATLLLMRGGTLVFDALSFLPASVAFFAWLRPRAEPLRGLLLLLLQPAVILVDHGHYQWNCLCLGLTLAAVVALGRGRWLSGAALFAGALNVKQMALYYSPAFFVLLLLVCVRGGTRALLGGGGAAGGAPPGARSVRVADAGAAVAAVGLAVAAVCALAWAPFCVWAAPEVGCAGGLQAVARRLFPLDRSLFEDKVSNLWCAAEPLLRLRARIYAAAASHGDGLRLRGRVAAASALLTGLLMLPSLAALWARLAALADATPPHRWAVGDAAALVSGGDAARPPPLGAPRTAAAAAAAAPAPEGTAATAPSPPPDGPPAPSRLGAATTAAAARRRRAAAAVAHAASAADASPSCEGGRRTHAPLPHARAPAAAAHAPPAPLSHPLASWAPWELLLAALAACALAFFLGAYQVHEKSVLLPLLPLAALQHRLPLLAAWFAALATWSMWPLLQADGLLAPAAALSLVHALYAWPSLEDVAAADGAAVSAALGGRLPPHSAARGLRALAGASLAALAALPLAAHTLAPPARLPDLFPYLSAVYVACLLLATLAALSGVLLAAARLPPPAVPPPGGGNSPREGLLLKAD